MYSSSFVTPAILVLSSLVGVQCQYYPQGNGTPSAPRAGSGAPIADDDMIYGFQPSSQPAGYPPTAIGSVDSSFGGPSRGAGGFDSQPPSDEPLMLSMREVDDGMGATGTRVVLSMGSAMPQYQMASDSDAMGSDMGPGTIGASSASSGAGSSGIASASSMGSSSTQYSSMGGLPMGGSSAPSMNQSGPSSDPSEPDNDDGGYYPETDPPSTGNQYPSDTDNDNDGDDYPDSSDYNTLPMSTGPSTIAIPIATSSTTVPVLTPVTGTVVPTGSATVIPVFEGSAVGRYTGGACWIMVAVAGGAAVFV